MREIKFRAWDKRKCEYIYDYQETYDFENYGFYSPEYLDYEQYTGLKDKNGKEIYEGDVVYLAGFGDLTVEDCGFDLWDAVKSGNADDIGSIIGNIHEDKL